MPFSEISLATQHYPRQHRHLSPLENVRRCDTSLEAYRHALHHARTTSSPTSEQRTMLRLPLHNEEMSFFAWRTKFFEGKHTNAQVQIPQEFRISFGASDASRVLPITTRRSDFIIASKRHNNASASMRIQYSARSLEVAHLDWTCGDSANDSGMLGLTKTVLTVGLEGSAGEFLEDWPGPFSIWMEDTLCEFMTESAKSSTRHMFLNRVWEDARRAATASTATSIPDCEVALQLLRLPGNEGTLLEEQLVDEEEDI